MAHPLIKKLLDLLREAGKIPPQYTGKVTLTLNIAQGGVSEAEVTLTEKIR